MTSNNIPSMAKRERWLLILLLGALTALGPLAIDLYLPALPAIADSMGAPLSQIQYTLSAYTIGFALSQLIYGPLSDRFGRRVVLVPGVLFFALISVLAGFCTTAVELIIVRVLQAFSAAAIMVTIPAMIRDLFPAEQVAKAISSILMVMTIAPLVAPLLGGQILNVAGWQTLFFTLAAISSVMFVVAWFQVKESLPVEDRLMVSAPQLLLNYGNIVKNREAMGYILCHSFFFGGMFAFITGSPFIYIELYGIPTDQYGLLFAVNIVMMTLTNLLNIRLVDRFSSPNILRGGSLLASVAALILLLNAVMGWGGLLGLIVPIAVYIACISLTGPNSNAMAMSLFPRSAGSANALAGAVRFVMAGIASAMVGVLHNGTAVPMTAVMAACGALSVLAFHVARAGQQPPQADNTPFEPTPH